MADPTTRETRQELQPRKEREESRKKPKQDAPNLGKRPNERGIKRPSERGVGRSEIGSGGFSDPEHSPTSKTPP